VAMIVLSTAAMKVAIRHAASTSVRRREGVRVARLGPACLAGYNPSSGTTCLVMVLDAACFLSPRLRRDNLRGGRPAVLSRLA
jgi:hypothetical protein